MIRLIKRLYYRIDQRLQNLKFRCQRFRRGWADEDAWDIDFWFRETMQSMLTYFLEHIHSYPTSDPDIVCLSDDENLKLWKDTISKMIGLLNKMDPDPDWDEPGNYEDRSRIIEQIQTHREEAYKAKDEFFQLFSKYFYNLWD